MSLSKRITLTIKDYSMTLSGNLNFYVNDCLDLVFEINKWGIDNKKATVNDSKFDLTGITAYLFVENSNLVDSIEATKIEDNEITFKFTNKYTILVGKGRMQIKLVDEDGCELKLPPFNYNIESTINEFADMNPDNESVLVSEDGAVLLTEDGKLLMIPSEFNNPNLVKISDLPVVDSLKYTDDLLVNNNGVTKRVPVSDVKISTEQAEYISKIPEITSQLEQKMNVGDKIKVSQVDKNQGKFDQTYMTDEFLRQITGNAPVNATPADGGVTTEKLADESVTFEKITDKAALTSLNPYNLFNDPLLKLGKSVWKYNNAVTPDNITKIDGFNTFKIIKNAENNINNMFYQSKKDLKDKTKYTVSAYVFSNVTTSMAVQWFRYKENVYVSNDVVSHIIKPGLNFISGEFTSTNDICDEYRIAFTLTSFSEVWIGKPLLIESIVENKYFSNYDGARVLKNRVDKLVENVQFNPSNLNNDQGAPQGWSINNTYAEYSNVEIDGFKTLKVWSSDGSTVIPYKAINFGDTPYRGTLTTSMKVKVVLKEGMSYPAKAIAMSLAYPVGASTGGTSVRQEYTFTEDGIYEISVTQTFSEWGKIHGCFSLASTAIDCYVNQLTIVEGDTPQPHTITALFNVTGKHEKEIKELYSLTGQTVEDRSINPLWGKIIALNGDSICANNGGYGKIIANRNNMTYQNVAVGGGTVTAETYYLPENYPQYDVPVPRHWVCRTIEKMRADADYVILEGGINDFWNKVPLGEVTPNYTNAFDDTTFCGALESVIKQAILKWPGKKIGYIIVHKITNTYYPYGNSTPGKFELFREKIIEICNKWSIPYLDLFNCSGLNVNIPELKQKYTQNGDGTHPNTEGYEAFYVPKIEAWMKTL